MHIDTEHLHYWMNAIRMSGNPKRTLDAFWNGQIKSKEWLIDQLSYHIPDDPSVEIHGGWVGVLASMMFQTQKLNIKSIISVDIDPICQDIAEEMNRIEYYQNRFRAATSDMCKRYPVTNVVINTSCEHISQEQYDIWLSHMFNDQLLVLQSNNLDIYEHTRIAKDLSEFKEQSKLSKIYYEGVLDLQKYSSGYERFMLIGQK